MAQENKTMNISSLAEKAAKAKAAKAALRAAQKAADEATAELLEAQVEADAEKYAEAITTALFSDDKAVKALNREIKKATKKPKAKKAKKKVVVLPKSYSVAPGMDPAISYCGEESFEEKVKKYSLNLDKHVYIPSHRTVYNKTQEAVRAAVSDFIIDKANGTAVIIWQNGEKTFDHIVTRTDGTVDELLTATKIVAKYVCGNNANATSVLFNMANLASYVNEDDDKAAISRHRAARERTKERRSFRGDR